MKDGFIKVAAASPMIKVADADYNAGKVIECMKKAADKGVKVLVFPELTLTGCSCYDLVGHSVILRGAERALEKVIEASAGSDMLVIVGLPYAPRGGALYSVAAVISDGELLGLVPRSETDGTLFAAADDEGGEETVCGKFDAFFDTELLFTSDVLPGLSVAVELGADADAIDAPAARHALAGATVIASLASFPATVTSTIEATEAVKYRSKHLKCGVILAAPGKGESTTDNVYSGLCMVAENGEVLASDECEDCFVVSEIDVEYLENLRRKSGKYGRSQYKYSHSELYWGEEVCETELTRTYRKLPHLPEFEKDMGNYCRRMIDIQVSGLVKRMTYAGLDHCVVGISGGLDSTLALLVIARAFDMLGLPRENIISVTMPAFGTTDRTYNNAVTLTRLLHATLREINIKAAVLQHFQDIGHDPEDHSVVYENAQARERTQILMDIANQSNGIVIGTGDLSELALGWATYNGDHMSMYGVNASVPKTLVRHLVKWAADTERDAATRATLLDIIDTPVSPELLPADAEGKIAQKTEDLVGPYELHDFFLYNFLRAGYGPAKILLLAEQAFEGSYDRATILKWLTVFVRRFFTQQFKRSAMPDGPKVGSVSLSPRGDWRMPSDASAAAWLREVEEL